MFFILLTCEYFTSSICNMLEYWMCFFKLTLYFSFTLIFFLDNFILKLRMLTHLKYFEYFFWNRTIFFSSQELQNDLEAEQVKVNSLTHMVVVVDENSGESATAALEEQLQVSQPETSAVRCRKSVWMQPHFTNAFFFFFSLWANAGQPFVAGQRRGGTSYRKSSWCGSSWCRIR